MTVYAFRCTGCGDFDVSRPMGTAAVAESCPGCGQPGRRSFHPPMLRRLDVRLGAAVSRAEASADAPEIVNAVAPDPRRRTRITTNPRHAALPRP